MNIVSRLAKALTDPRLEGIDYNSDALLNVHRRILLEKRMMRDVFAEFYGECITLDRHYFQGSGKTVEIGAGVSFFKDAFPELISTDIKKGDRLDMVVDALNMPFSNGTVRGIYGINCFHHFPDPEKFFKELQRVLVNGGGCILIEPYHGLVAARFFRHLFVTETFDKEQPTWKNEDNNVMSGANQALSYVVFSRDRERFQTLFPELEVVYTRPLNNYLRYLVSGGLNFRSLMPGFMSPTVQVLETLCIPLSRILALHHIIVIRKKLNQA